MAADYTPLKTMWAALPAGNSVDQNLLPSTVGGPNALVAGPNIDVPVSSVAEYLFSNLKIGALKSYVAAPPSAADPETVEIANLLVLIVTNQAPFPSFRTSVVSNYAAFEGMLGLLAADMSTGIATADQTAILALAATTQPWWQANGFTGPITIMDLEAEACGLVPLGTY